MSKLYYFAALLLVLPNVVAHCEVSSEDPDRCHLTVFCVSNPTSVGYDECSDRDVRFIITGSTSIELHMSFFGATNFDRRVWYIRAYDNAWTTIEREALRYFINTITLEINNNKIRSLREKAFWNLYTLKTLNLSRNEIEDIHESAFQVLSGSSVCDLTALDLSYNKLVTLPGNVFYPIQNLKTLILKGNQLTSLPLNSFDKLKSLEKLDMSYNDLKFLNMSLGEMEQLEELNLNHNKILNILSYDIKSLKSLVFLNISHNSLESLEGDTFATCRRLKIVDLSYNSIRTKIENVLFGFNMNLEYLNLYNNRISRIDNDSFKQTRLTYFNIENNILSGSLNSSFSGIQNITDLNLSHQNLTALTNNAFQGMLNLKTLNISHNSVCIIENSTFVGINNVTILDLSSNNINDLSFTLADMSILNELYLNNNNITDINDKIFKDLNNLIKLDLSMNKIVTIPPFSLPLQRLQFLNLQSNKLKGNITANTFSPAPMLRFLDLGAYNFSKIEENAFINMSMIARLNLSHNVIDFIHEKNFINLNNLFSLDLSFNNLSQIKMNTTAPKNLKSLYLNNNYLNGSFNFFQNSSNITYLDLSNNGLTNLSGFRNIMFPKLEVLHLSHNNIQKFNDAVTNSLTNLIELGFSSNNMTEIDLSFFKELLIIDLSNNTLSFINNTLLKYNDFVQSLDVSRNNISDLPPGTFQNMRNMKFLNMSCNHLTKLRYGSLKGLHKTELIDLSYNNIQYLDVNVFHECTQLKSLIIDYNRIKTINIDKLVYVTQNNLKSLSIGGNPMSCQEVIRNYTSTDLSSHGINQIIITSIHKIYHEDNVHGIKCGDNQPSTIKNDNATEKIKDNESTESSSVKHAIMYTVLCCIIVLLLGLYVKFGTRYFVNRRRGNVAIYRDSTARLSLPSELSSSDLLG